MSTQFVSEAITPIGESLDTGALSRGEPPLPAAFRWRDEELVISEVRRTWRSTVTDRGDKYLARHWYEVMLRDGRSGVLYFDRKARAKQARWWLYTIGDDEAPGRSPGR